MKLPPGMPGGFLFSSKTTHVFINCHISSLSQITGIIGGMKLDNYYFPMYFYYSEFCNVRLTKWRLTNDRFKIFPSVRR